METKIAWIKLERNSILKEKDWYISYNPQTGIGHGFITDLGNALGADVKDGEETALKTKKGEWLILEGDYRKEYEAVFPNYKKCLAVYEANKEHRSNWSTD